MMARDHGSDGLGRKKRRVKCHFMSRNTDHHETQVPRRENSSE